MKEWVKISLLAIVVLALTFGSSLLGEPYRPPNYSQLQQLQDQIEKLQAQVNQLSAEVKANDDIVNRWLQIDERRR